MAVRVPDIQQATPADGDTVLGTKGGALRNLTVGGENGLDHGLRNDLATPGDASGAVAGSIAFDPGSTVEPRTFADEAIVRAASGGRGGAVAFVFDDGYRSNYTVALPIFKRYGMAATIAHEVERTGQNYNGNPALPVCTAQDLRELIAAGWEVCNHPSLNLDSTEAEMVAAAKAENDLLRELLTGAKVMVGSTPTPATPSHPEFATYPVTSAVYRGGARNETSDRAYRFLYDKTRTINGPVATRGDALYAFTDFTEHPTLFSAFPVDTSARPLDRSLAFLESIAQAGATAIIYAHDTPASGTSTVPFINGPDLEKLLQRCRDLGISVVPLARLDKGNAVADSTFADATGSFQTRAGDTAEFSTSDTLNGSARCVRLVSTASVGNNNTNYTASNFICQPFCRYRIRVRYKIDDDLNIGGVGNRNHGLNIILSTTQANTAGEDGGGSLLNDAVLNDPDALDRLPYQATDGYAEAVAVLSTGNGQEGLVRVSLRSCTGEVRVGQIIVEKLGSLITIPLSGYAALNTTTFRAIRLPSLGANNSRAWRWEVSVICPTIEPSATYDFAFADSASVPSPVNGTTCYVIGLGSGSFAGQTGRLATYNGSSWSFSTIPIGTFFKVNNGEGILNRWIRHRGLRTGAPPLFEELYAPIIKEDVVIKRQTETEYRLYSPSGNQTTVVQWVARPVPQ